MAAVLFFGRLQDVAGGRAKQMNLDGLVNIEDLIAALAKDSPRLGEALNETTVRCILNDAIVPRSALLVGAREVAFIPPVGGG